jgi:hypothetical protein
MNQKLCINEGCLNIWICRFLVNFSILILGLIILSVNVYANEEALSQKENTNARNLIIQAIAKNIITTIGSEDYLVGVYKIALSSSASDEDKWKWIRSTKNINNIRKERNELGVRAIIMKLDMAISKNSPQFITIDGMRSGDGMLTTYLFTGGECSRYLVIGKKDSRYPSVDHYTLPFRFDSIYGSLPSGMFHREEVASLKHIFEENFFDALVTHILELLSENQSQFDLKNKISIN